MLRGLFIGIDRYRSSHINWLSCARRDAVALHALFSDTLGGESTLLTDEQAVRANILAEIARLAAAESDDLVVIAFSGHGSETHELVAYDTEVHDLVHTGLPLDGTGGADRPDSRKTVGAILGLLFFRRNRGPGVAGRGDTA